MKMNLLKLLKKNKKLLGINFLFLLLFLLLPPFLLKLIEKKKFFSTHRAEYSVYQDKKISRKIFSEINLLSSEYILISFLRYQLQSDNF